MEVSLLMEEHSEPVNGNPEPTRSPARGRRSFLKLVGRVGLAVVGGVAGATATAEPAEAHPRPPCRQGLYQFACCCLAKPPGSCPGSGSTHTCNCGYKRIWSCCASGRQWYCSECTRYPDPRYATCKTGPFCCSEAYRTGRICG
jgi:hypothetical protein